MLLVFHIDMMCIFQAVANLSSKSRASSPFYSMSDSLLLCPDFCKFIAYFLGMHFSRCYKESVSHIKETTMWARCIETWFLASHPFSAYQLDLRRVFLGCKVFSLTAVIITLDYRSNDPDRYSSLHCSFYTLLWAPLEIFLSFLALYDWHILVIPLRNCRAPAAAR